MTPKVFSNYVRYSSGFQLEARFFHVCTTFINAGRQLLRTCDRILMVGIDPGNWKEVYDGFTKRVCPGCGGCCRIDEDDRAKDAVVPLPARGDQRRDWYGLRAHLLCGCARFWLELDRDSHTVG